MSTDTSTKYYKIGPNWMFDLIEIDQAICEGKQLAGIPNRTSWQNIRRKLENIAVGYVLDKHDAGMDKFNLYTNEMKRLDDHFGITAIREAAKREKKKKERLLYEKFKAKYETEE